MKPGRARVVALFAAAWALLPGGAGVLRADGIPLAAIAAGSDGGAETDAFDFWNLRATKPLPGGAWGLFTAPPPLVPRLAEADAPPEAAAPVPSDQFTDLLRHLSAPPDTPLDSAYDPWSAGLKRDPGRLSHSAEARGELLQLQLQSKQDVPDPLALRSDPLAGRTWNAAESVKLPVPAAESIFLFGEMNGSSDPVTGPVPKVNGKTGLGWKWSLGSKSELQLRGGPTFNYGGLSQTAAPGTSQFAVELLAKTPLVGSLQLQYLSTALPSLTATDPTQLKQDLKLALPLRNGGEFHVGARYSWQDVQASTPWFDRAQLYFGVNFKR